MPYRPISLRHPLGGVVRRFSFTNQDVGRTCIDALNVWASDFTVDSGRARISTRPGLGEAGVEIGTPYGWAEISWDDTTAKRGVAIVHSGGVRVLRMSSGNLVDYDGTGNSTDFITTDPASDFCSTCQFIDYLVMTSAGLAQARANSLQSGSAGTGTQLSSLSGDTTPTNCGICVSHLDRLWLMGDAQTGRVVYACKTGDITDWDYADTNNGTAIAFTFSLPQNVTAAISHTRDCLIIGMTDSVVVVRGNLPSTGEIATISHEVGPLSHHAWCHDASGTLWIFTRDGLYKMAPGCGDFLQSVGRETLPGELVAVDPGTSGTYCSLTYDHRWRGLHLYIDVAGTDQFWFYDLQNGGWWPMSFDNGPLRLGVPLKSAATSTDSSLLAFNASGTGYQFVSDDNESFDSKVLYGPIALGQAGAQGILHSICATLGSDSDAVAFKIFTGNSAEEAYDNYVSDTASFDSAAGTDWTEGLNTWQHVRTSHSFAYVGLYGSTTDRWAIEEIIVRLVERGLRRV